MATQGILSITKAGAVQLKVISGCNGMNVEPLAQHLRQTEDHSPQNVQRLCKELGVGCLHCLVIQTAPRMYLTAVDINELGDLFPDKFDDPTFNPRWPQGFASYTEIVESR